MYVCVCAHACARVCVCICARACVCVCVCARPRVCMRQCQKRCRCMSVHIAVSQMLKEKKDKKARKLKGDAAESEVTFVRTNTTLSVATQDSDR